VRVKWILCASEHTPGCSIVAYRADAVLVARHNFKHRASHGATPPGLGSSIASRGGSVDVHVNYALSTCDGCVHALEVSFNWARRLISYAPYDLV
jgi:hypothetical protein